MRYIIKFRLVPLLILIVSAAVSSATYAERQEDFLKPDQAFKFSAKTTKDGYVVANWIIAPGYHLYRKRFKFSVKNKSVKLGKAIFPAGDIDNDQFFGKMEVYHHKVNVRIPVQTGNSSSKSFTLVATYQGCAQAGMCYPPMTKDVVLPVSDIVKVKNGGASQAESNKEALSEKTKIVSEQDKIAHSLASDNIFLALLAFFGFGVLLSFTPCVFPMMPILSSIIVGQGENITGRKAFILSLIYVLSVSVTYTFTGVMAGLLGDNIQAAFQNPWAIGSFAAIFVALSFSMFGFYDLQLPASLQSKLAEISNNQQGGKLIGVAIMGFLSALIVGPCVAAPLAGALIYIGQTGNAVLGGLALFSLSLGMGIPLLVIGTSAGKLLPKAGNWMEAIKAVFGVMMLGLAIWMLDRIIPSWLTQVLTATLIVISSIYIGALDNLGENPNGWRRFRKGVGIVMLLNGAFLFASLVIGGFGNYHVFQSLSGATMSNAKTMQSEKLKFVKVKNIADVNNRITEATKAGRTVMLDFYADWCVSCKELEKYTFSNPQVQSALRNVVLLQADVTSWDSENKKFTKAFKVIGPPAILFFDKKSGNERRSYRVVGFMKPEKFSQHVKQVIRSE